MNFDLDSIKNKNKILTHLPQWWLSIILVFFSWFIVKQYWIAIDSNIFRAVSYDHIFGFSIIYFVMDNLSLIIHEAGHTIFGIFGWRFLTILGGTLLECLIPFLIVIFGWKNKKLITTQIGLYWLGFTCLDAAAYASDAFYRQLPLIGNLPKSAHDYFNLLSELNLLRHYKTVAWILFSLGCLILLLGIIFPVFHYNRAKEVNLDLDL